MVQAVKTRPKIKKADCPVQPFTLQVLTSARELAAALRKLRQSMSICRNCISDGDCPILADFNAKFQTALQQVTDEWQLT
jgi:hypothetical protein